MQPPEFPARVGLGSAASDAVKAAYQKAFVRIAEQLQNTTDFGYQHRAILLRQIQKIIADYGIDVNAFIDKEIPAQYQKGVQLALAQINYQRAGNRPPASGSQPTPAPPPPPSPTPEPPKAELTPYWKSVEESAAEKDWVTVAGMIEQGKLDDPMRQIMADKYAKEIEAAGLKVSRPSHQQLIEQANMKGDLQEVKRLIDEMPDSDPYKASMQSLFADKLKNLPPAPSATPALDERPTHQAMIEAAANEGDMVKLRAIIASMNPNDPYTQSMIDSFDKQITDAGLPSLKGERPPVAENLNTNMAAKVYAKQAGLPTGQSETQQAIMDAWNAGDKAKVAELVAALPDDDPLKPQWEKMLGMQPEAIPEGAPNFDLQPFTTIDKEAVASLITNAKNGIGAAMAGVNKNMTQLLSDAQKAHVKEILVNGKISGEARQSIRAQVIADFQDSGIGSLEDAGGKTWQLDTYSDMLIRTTSASARNDAINNTVLQAGEDLVQISSHGASDVCGDWEGAVLSISGDHADDPGVDGSLDDAIADGLFHPNCEHTESAYIPDLSDEGDQAIQAGAGIDLSE